MNEKQQTGAVTSDPGEVVAVPSSDKLSIQQQLALEEWKAISSALQTFGAKRFAQLTVFIAATAGLVTVLTSERSANLGNIAGVLRIGGVFLAVMFGIMEYSTKEYWKAYEERARKIEGEILPELKLMREVNTMKSRKLKRWEWRRYISATVATFAIYFVVGMVWVGWFLSTH